jgi:hypothetical protein
MATQKRCHIWRFKFLENENTYIFNARGGIPLFFGKNSATEALTARKICNASQILSI